MQMWREFAPKSFAGKILVTGTVTITHARLGAKAEKS